MKLYTTEEIRRIFGIKPKVGPLDVKGMASKIKLVSGGRQGRKNYWRIIDEHQKEGG